VNLFSVIVVLVGESIPPSSAGPPTSFQTIGVCLLGTLFVLSLAAIFLGRATRREGIAWALVWFCAAVAIIKPELTVRVAKALGIGRGADFVLYCSVVAMMVGFMMMYVRLRRLQRELTIVVRHLALREASVGANPEEGSAGANQRG
jgi:hypothetical protein